MKKFSKKYLVLLFAAIFVVSLSVSTAFSTEEKTFNVTYESGQLMLRRYDDKDGTSEPVIIKLNPSTSIGYQEIVLPKDFDFENTEFYLDFFPLVLGYSNDTESIDNETQDALVRSIRHHWRFSYVKGDSQDKINISGVSSPDGSMKLEKGGEYTIYLTVNEWQGYNIKKSFNLPSDIKFAFKVVEPAITEGENGTVTIDAEKDYTIKANMPFDTFEGVKVNGNELIKDTDYTAEAGSTIVTLKADYLKTLTKGEYKVELLFNNGVVLNATLTLQETQPTTENTTNSTTDNTTENTVDNTTENIVDNTTENTNENVAGNVTDDTTVTTDEVNNTSENTAVTTTADTNKETAPKTADNSWLMVFCAVMLASALGMLLIGRKKAKNNK